MLLAPGFRLGPYEVLAPLGTGGMGEVYRARDAKLGRGVALKVLPELFAADQGRLARFQREAHVLASLNHPNIAAIYGLEESGGITALVLELVEGETLAERIVVGPIPLDEALSIAHQIAEALEAAHEQGIVHRDLKPANVKVRDDGTVKVLDFGLAKALAPAPTSFDKSQSTTMTSPAETRMGVILGTAAYMSPEQARGKPVDKRADIWAYGVVLYECLVGGKPVFGGETVSDSIAAILARDVDWHALPSTTPPELIDVLRRCLQRDPNRRLRDIGDARIVLDEIGVAPGRVSSAPPAVVRQKNRSRRLMPAAVGAVAGALLASALTWIAVRPGVPSRPEAKLVQHFTITLPRTGRSHFHVMRLWILAVQPSPSRRMEPNWCMRPTLARRRSCTRARSIHRTSGLWPGRKGRSARSSHQTAVGLDSLLGIV